jgi:3-methylcrotonyl-CoA carboxylase alpha subunit
VDTGLIDRDLEALAAAPVACSRTRALAAMGALGLTAEAGPVEGFTLWAPLRRSVMLRADGEDLAAAVEVLPGGAARVTLGGTVHGVSRDGGRWRVDGAPVSAEVVPLAGSVAVFWGNGYVFDVVDPLEVAAAAGGGAGRIEAPMPGLVKAVYVSAGDAVSAGDRLAVLEAMKMEHSLTAGRDGVVAEVLVEAGAQVEAGAALIVLEEDAE